jgi:hypothetical protein
MEIPQMTRRTVLTVAILCAAVSHAAAQNDGKLPKWRIDPYTRNEPRALELLGYVSYGPFEFGERGAEPTTSEFIDRHMHYERILWVETAHFRIGSSLGAWTVPFDPEIKAKIRDELTRLKERGKLSRVNPKTRTLDPWLRLHLLAQRLEEHYALMQDWLGVTDASFPQDEEARRAWRGDYIGEGPYMGQKGKFLFLVFQETAAYVDYLKSFTGRNSANGQQWNFKVVDSLLYAVAADDSTEGGRLEDDTALHGHLVHAATHNIINGYLHYNYDLPVWIREGLAHWFERKISPRFNSFTRSEGAANLNNRQWQWELETRKNLASGKFTPFSEAYTWRDFGQMEFDDHVMIWSRWDYLLSLGKEKFARFMKLAKGRIDNSDGTMQDDLLAGTREALQEAYGMSPLILEERWMEWVKANYATR